MPKTSATSCIITIMNLAISVKKKKKTVVISDLTVRNDKFNDKRKNINILLKCKCKEGKYFFDNSNVTVGLITVVCT